MSRLRVPKIVSVFERLPSPTLDRFAAERRVDLITPPPKLSFEALNEWFQSQLKGANAAITWPAVRFVAQQIATVSDFKVVSTYSVGTDAIDRAACRRAGIRVGYTPYIGDDSVAEYAVAMLLAHFRRLGALRGCVREGRFVDLQRAVLDDPTLHCGGSPAGKTVGFYGFGRIAQKVTEKLLPFGIGKVIYTTSSEKPFTATNFARLHTLRENFYPQTQISPEPNLHILAAQSDILVVLCPETPSTIASINSTVFDRMKPTAVLINVARGSIVVNDHLEKALRARRIAAALLDVVDGEPYIDASHPLLAQDLQERVVILPHAASTVVETRVLMAEVTARNVLTQLGFADESLGDKSTLLERNAWTHFVQ